MNGAKSFVGGWAAFFGCTMTGATLGYFRWKSENAVRLEENEVLKVEREAELQRIRAKAQAAKARAALAAAAPASPAPSPPPPPPSGDRGGVG